MSYTLYGSLPSPFTRRIRIVLENQKYEFKNLDIYGNDAGLINEINPLNQIPALVHGDLTIIDSRIIFNYLNEIHHFEERTWKDENLLSIIDGATLSGVNIFLSKRSGINTDENVMFFNRQRDRLASTLIHFKPFLNSPDSKEWNFNTISLFCFLNWAFFRGVIDQAKHPEASAFVDYHSTRAIAQSTAIPKT